MKFALDEHPPKGEFLEALVVGHIFVEAGKWRDRTTNGSEVVRQKSPSVAVVDRAEQVADTGACEKKKRTEHNISPRRQIVV